MNSVKMLFTTTKSFNIFAWAIRKVLRTKYSHVAVMFWDAESQRNLVYHAGVFGIDILTEESFYKKNKVIHARSIDTVTNTKTRALNFCENYMQKSYGFLLIIGIFAQRVLHIKNSLGRDGNNTFICSEFAAKVLSILKPSISSKITEDIDPKELYALTKSI